MLYLKGEVAYIRVKEDNSTGGRDSRSLSYSPPPRRRGSPTYSPVHRSESPSRSRSPY